MTTIQTPHGPRAARDRDRGFETWRPADYELPPSAIDLEHLAEHATTWWVLDVLEEWEGFAEEEAATVNAAWPGLGFGWQCRILGDRDVSLDVERGRLALRAILDARGAAS